VFQTQLATLDGIRNLFITHNIGLEEERFLSTPEVSSLVLDAVELGHIFLTFLVATIINPNKDGFKTFFTTYEEVEEAYLCFYAGYKQTVGN